MKRIYIVRHAKASWHSSILKDYNRPLKKTGIKDATQIAQYLNQKKYTPDYVLSSGSVRTVETTNVMIQELFNNTSLCPINFKKILYNTSIEIILDLIKTIDKQYKEVMIVGHNPISTIFINEMSNTIIDNLPTSGVGIIEFDATSWLEINKDGKLIEFVYPKKLKLF